MKKCLLALSVAGAMAAPMLSESIYSTPSRKQKPVKKCLNCGKLHQHNNSFCSAECCKEFEGV